MTDQVKQPARVPSNKGMRGPHTGEEVALDHASSKSVLRGSEAEPDTRDSSEASVRSGPAQKDIRNQIQSPATARRIEQRLTVIPIRQIPQTEVAYERPPILLRASAGTKRGYGAYLWFVFSFVLPVTIATLYYGFIASNQYVAEFRFAVKDTSSASGAAASGLSVLLGMPATSDTADNYLVTSFLTSRQAVDELESKINVKELYSRPKIDWWARFDSSLPIERFVSYWQYMVSANYDPVTGIAVATVRAFSPQDAQLIADTLVQLSENLINQIANRAQIDAVRFAETEVRKAQDRLKNVRAQLTKFRSEQGIIDPTTSVVASNSALVQSLHATLAQLETSLTTLTSQNLSPNAPAVRVLKSQIAATKAQLVSVESDVSKDRAGGGLSTVVAKYEQLDLERQFAQAMVTSTMQALDQARANAAAQHLFITPFVRPALPQSSTYPNRPVSVLLVTFYSFLTWLIGFLVARSVSEN